MTVRVRLAPVLMKEALACFAKGRSIIEIGCPENALGLESSEDCAFCRPYHCLCACADWSVFQPTGCQA